MTSIEKLLVRKFDSSCGFVFTTCFLVVVNVFIKVQNVYCFLLIHFSSSLAFLIQQKSTVRLQYKAFFLCTCCFFSVISYSVCLTR